MLERVTARTLPLANRASDFAPMAPACCNACRVCATSGAVGLIFVAGGAVSAFFLRLTRNLVKSS